MPLLEIACGRFRRLHWRLAAVFSTMNRVFGWSKPVLAMGSPIEAPVSDLARQYLRLQLTKDVGPVRLRNLVNHFGSLPAVFSASSAELERVDGVGPHVARQVLAARNDDAVQREASRASEFGLRIICREDVEFPEPLRRIPDAPICLYVRGRLEPADAAAVAIVGTRRCSHYGREQALRFGQLLGRAGFTVVSGLARGIDGHAHRGALDAGGRTIAVLGNGLPDIYPPEHKSLAVGIEAAGAIVTELPIDCPPDSKNFPRRNRIIAGLSLGVIVIEGGKTSGALITAEVARKYGRKVLAVPGRVDQPELSAGVHELIRKGQAKLVTCLEDILEELPAPTDSQPGLPPSASQAADLPAVPKAPRLTEDEEAVWKAVKNGIDETDSIVTASNLHAGRVASAITSLELKGLLRRLPGNRFCATTVVRQRNLAGGRPPGLRERT